MERNTNTFSSLVDFLISHGYPKESLMIEWSINERYRADLAVVDPQTNKPVALFELKRKKTDASFNLAIRQLESYSNALGKEKVPLYVVFEKTGIPPFEIYHFQKDENKSDIIKISKVPDFLVFKNTIRSKMLTEKESEKKSTLNYFQSICRIVVFLLFILLILDFALYFKEIVLINAERLVLIGIVIGLIIIPFASKLKILGLEFERLKEE